MEQDDLQTIRRSSGVMSPVCVVAAVLFIVGSGWRGLTMTPAALALWLDSPVVAIGDGQRVGLVVALLIPAAINAWGLLQLRASFRRMTQGDVFSPPVIRGLRRFSAATILSVCAALVVTPLFGAWLTYDSAAGLDVPIDIGSGSITLLLVSGVTWIFARILTIAAALRSRNDALAQENEAFV